jgi:hypothetical protein
VLGLIFDGQPLFLQSSVQLVFEELTQIGNRHYTGRGVTWHTAMAS